jgi:hypothetical protein
LQQSGFWRAGWIIASRTWLLWVLHVLLLLTLLPAAVVVAGGFSALLALALPWAPEQPAWLTALRQTRPAGWVGISAAGMLLFTGSSAMVLVLQAAALRAARLAIEPGRHSQWEAFRLGGGRMRALAKVSVAVGMTLTGASVLAAFQLPPILADAGFRPGVLALGLLLGAVLAGLPLFMLMLAMVHDNLQPGAAAWQAWHVFRRHWRAFVLVYALSTGAAGLALAAASAAWVSRLVVASVNRWLVLALAGTMLPFVLYGVLFVSVYTLSVHTALWLWARPQPRLPQAGEE